MSLITHQRTLISFLFMTSVVHQPSREVMPLFDPIDVHVGNLVDSASSHTLVSKIKPCMSIPNPDTGR